MPGAEPFMEWAVETVLPREARKLTLVIEEKDIILTMLNDNLQDRDNQIQALEYTNEKERQAHQQEILRLNEEINELIANRHVARCGCFDNVLCFIRTAERLTHTTLFDASTGS